MLDDIASYGQYKRHGANNFIVKPISSDLFDVVMVCDSCGGPRLKCKDSVDRPSERPSDDHESWKQLSPKSWIKNWFTVTIVWRTVRPYSYNILYRQQIVVDPKVMNYFTHSWWVLRNFRHSFHWTLQHSLHGSSPTVSSSLEEARQHHIPK